MFRRDYQRMSCTRSTINLNSSPCSNEFRFECIWMCLNCYEAAHIYCLMLHLARTAIVSNKQVQYFVAFENLEGIKKMRGRIDLFCIQIHRVRTRQNIEARWLVRFLKWTTGNMGLDTSYHFSSSACTSKYRCYCRTTVRGCGSVCGLVQIFQLGVETQAMSFVPPTNRRVFLNELYVIGFKYRLLSIKCIRFCVGTLVWMIGLRAYSDILN